MGRRVANTLNNGLGRLLNANWNGRDLVAISRFERVITRNAHVKYESPILNHGSKVIAKVIINI